MVRAIRPGSRICICGCRETGPQYFRALPSPLDSITSSAALYRRAAAHHHEHQRQNDTDHRADPREVAGGAGDTGKTKDCRYQCNNKECYGPGNHVRLLIFNVREKFTTLEAELYLFDQAAFIGATLNRVWAYAYTPFVPYFTLRALPSFRPTPQHGMH